MSNAEKTLARPDWRDFEQYRHLLDLDRAGWAWEWLRRRPDYAGESNNERPNRGSRAKPFPTLIRSAESGLECQWGLCFC